MTEWDKAKGSRTGKIASIKKLVSSYDYSSEEAAHRTDDLLRETMIANLRTAKSDMFNVLNTAFERHQDLMIKPLERLRDEIDMFNDDIKIRTFIWDRAKSAPWLGKLVDYDYRILTGLGNLLRGIRELHRLVLEAKAEARDMRSIDEKAGAVKKELDELIAMFRERDVLCNLEDAALQEDFEGLSREIRKGI